MQHLLENFKTLDEIVNTKTVSLFLDFDGTLTPIVETPDKVQLSQSNRSILQRLAKMDKFRLTIISGRALSDIRRLVDIEGINYVGNHGNEIKVPGVEVNNIGSLEYSTLLDRLKLKISQQLIEFPGAFIEDKGITLSVHYRQVKPDLAMILEDMLFRMVQAYYDNNEINYDRGKMVFEIRPPIDWDKGKAALWILQRQHGFPIYIGDDTTDEDAFVALNRIGITIYVGNMYLDRFSAQYYLKNTDEVTSFLKHLEERKLNE